MPIAPENRGRYPKDWKAIRERILARATSPILEDHDGMLPRCECGGECGLHSGRRCTEFHGIDAEFANGRVILTIAHLDHTPENCADENLKAMCQRCHLRYDREHHERSRRARLERESGQGRLL